MYNIFAPERHRQYGSACWNYQSPIAAIFHPKADAKCLIQLTCSVAGGVRGMEQERHGTLARRFADLFRSGKQSAGARFQAKPVERRLGKRLFNLLRQIGWNFHRRLERAGQCTGELSFGYRQLKRSAIDTYPCAPARSPRTHVWRNSPIWPEREPDQAGARAPLASEDAFADGSVLAPILRITAIQA